ncbi:MAG: TonB-dependent receptor [Bacteroidota bacterium]|nr:TonB-dependent receptor [Bacteroidota bacterium]
MKVKIGCLLSAFLAVLFCNVYGQSTTCSIHGKVVTETKSPAEAATIILLKSRDSSIVSSTIVAKNGLFSFTAIPPDSYLLLVTAVGYSKLYVGPYNVEGGQNFKTAEIVLKQTANQLREVTVIGTRPEIEVRPGKITLNIPNSLTADGSSALEILRQSPGVRVDNGNNINIIGRQSALITIDGKTLSLSGDDLAAYLRSIQSNMIDKIELITAASSKYDASAGGIVNIVLKKGNNLGANGTLTATGGYGKYYKSVLGATFNDRMDKFNVFASFSHAADKTFHNFVNNRIIDFEDVLSDYHVDYNGIQKSNNNNFRVGADLFITPNQTIGFLIDGFSRGDTYTKDNALKISNNGTLDSIITADSHLQRNITKVNYNVNYTGKLDKAGSTLSADFNYTAFSRSSSEYITNKFYNADLTPYRDSLLQENLSPSNIHVYLSKIDFSTPLAKTGKFEAGIKYSHASSNNDQVFGPMVNGVYQVDANLSNRFYYTENINAAYVGYENKFNKFDVSAGLRGEQTSAKGNSVTSDASIDRSYFSLFPNLQLVYKENEKNEFSLSYNHGITRPLYEDINPFLYYVDLYDYRSGNPNLKPEYSDNIEISHTYNKSITTTLYTSIIKDAYEFGFYEQNDTSKVNIKTQINLGWIYNYGIKISVPVRVTSWWNANFYADVSYQRYVAYAQNGNLNKGTQDIILQTSQNFIISKTLNATIGGDYESPNFYGINQNRARYMANAAIGTQLFNKRGTLRLVLADIFNTLQDRGQINYGNLNLMINDKTESQVARLTFTYRFGKTSVKGITAHRTGNEEEVKRIGGGPSGN